MQMEKFSKFVLFLNQKTNNTFGTKNELYFRYTDFLYLMSQLQYRNENQNFISNLVLQFIKKNEMAL